MLDDGPPGRRLLARASESATQIQIAAGLEFEINKLELTFRIISPGQGIVSILYRILAI